jgi:endonuclease/exonuclease/phosphatase family metal-dependent hydrolase
VNAFGAEGEDSNGAAVWNVVCIILVVRFLGSMTVLMSVAGVISTTACRSPGRGADARGPSSDEEAHAAPLLTTREASRHDGSRMPRACAGQNAKIHASAPREHVRIASWNVRWFPDGRVQPVGKAGTDVFEMSCIVALLDAPVIALQELRRHALAREKLAELTALLRSHVGGDWQLEVDRCPDANEADTHLGFLFDARRVSAGQFRNVDELNPRGGCNDGIHPGFSGYFRFPGGLDLSLVNVHMMWGTEAEALELRRSARAAVHQGAEVIAAQSGDNDLIVLGDFNTNGCTTCSERMDPMTEVEEAERTLASGSPAFSLVPNDAACTEYDGATPLPLDHIAVTAGMPELPRDARVRVSGVCPELGCKPLVQGPTDFHRRLSDHCPIVLELIDRDID